MARAGGRAGHGGRRGGERAGVVQRVHGWTHGRTDGWADPVRRRELALKGTQSPCRLCSGGVSCCCRHSFLCLEGSELWGLARLTCAAWPRQFAHPNVVFRSVSLFCNKWSMGPFYFENCVFILRHLCVSALTADREVGMTERVSRMSQVRFSM